MNLHVKTTLQLLILNGSILVGIYFFFVRLIELPLGSPLIVGLLLVWLWNLRSIIVELKPRAIALNIKFGIVFLVIIPYIGVIIALWLGKKLSATVSLESIEKAKKNETGNFRSF